MAATHHLAVLGGFAAGANDGLPKGTKTLLLLGPAEPGFWPHLKTQGEWGSEDPVDRWSRRVIGQVACDLGAKALFPFGEPPYHPFYRWALKSGGRAQNGFRAIPALAAPSAWRSGGKTIQLPGGQS